MLPWSADGWDTRKLCRCHHRNCWSELSAELVHSGRCRGLSTWFCCSDVAHRGPASNGTTREKQTPAVVHTLAPPCPSPHLGRWLGPFGVHQVTVPHPPLGKDKEQGRTRRGGGEGGCFPLQAVTSMVTKLVCLNATHRGHEATDTELAYTPVSQAYGHRHNSLCALVCLVAPQRKPDQRQTLP